MREEGHKVSDTWGVAEAVRLRPIEESDLPEVLRLIWDPEAPGEYQWFGFRVDVARDLERRWHEDGLIGSEKSFMVVESDNACAGWMSWKVLPTGNVEIGIALFPEFRGRGIGTAAQRQMVQYLFDTTPVHRIQAGTEIDNIAEQRSLERVGFQREGVVRGAAFRAGRWRDGVMYSLLRDDLRPPT